MATSGDLKAKLVVEASAEGNEDIIKLGDEVGKLATKADKVAPEFAALAAEIAKLGQQQAAITGFERLKAATAESAAKLEQLQQATRAAALALKEKQAALAAANAAEQAASGQLAQAREQQAAMGAAVKQLREELRAQALAAKASGDSSAVMAEKLADGRAQLGVLVAGHKAAAAATKELEQAQRSSARAASEAARDAAASQKSFDGLRQSTAQAKDALAANSQELQRSRDGLAALGLSAKALSDAQTQLNRGLDASRAGLSALAAKAEDAAAVLANRELLGVRAHADVQKEIDKTRQAYEALRASGKLSSVELAQAALKTEERVRELKAQTNGWAQSLGNAKSAFAGVAAGGAGIAVATREAIKFESAMADVAKVVDASDAQMAGLVHRLKEMSGTIPLTVAELAQIAAAGGQLGVPIEKLDQFIELAAQMATAFNLSAEQSGQAVAKLMNIFNLPLEGVRKLGDAINVLGNTSAATEADIVNVLTRIGGSAKQFGLSAQQAAALAAAMLSLGVPAEVAGTGINALLAKLQTAGTQGKEFQQALAGMGISANQLARDIRENPQKALSGFLDTVSGIEKGRQAEILARLFGLEYQDDMARLLTGLDGYRKALKSVSDESAVAGAMQKEFDNRVQTTEAQLKLLKNEVNAVAVNLGTVLLPVLKPMISGVKDAAEGIANFAEKFPLISAAAAGLVTLAASAGALGLTFAAMRVAGTKSLAAITAMLPGMVTGMGAAAAASTTLKTALGGIGAAGVGAMVGWDIGTYLRKEFLVAEQAGIALAAGLTKTAAMAQAAWEMLKAPFNDDTIEQAQERLRLKLAQIDDEYAQMFISAGQARDVQQQQAAAADAAAASTQKQAAAQTQAAQATLSAADQASRLVSEYAALKDGAEGAAGATEKLAASLKVTDVQNVAGFAQALENLRTTGVMSAEEVGVAWQQALAKLSSADLQQLHVSLDVAKAKGLLTAQEWAAANEQILGASFERLGVNAAQALGRISSGAQEAINTVDLVADAAAAAGVKTEQAARAIEMAFTAAIPRADSLEAIAELEKQLKALGAAGKISAEGVQRTQAALDRQRATIEDQLPGIQSLGEALRQLGVKPQAELKALADAARQAFDKVKSSGTATTREINQAWKAMAEAAIAANDGVADAALKSQAAQHGFAVTTDESGKSVVESMKKAEEATKAVGAAAQAAAGQMGGMADAAWKASEDLVAQARAHNAALGELQGTWLDATAAASRYAAEMAKLVFEAGKSTAAMRAEHAQLVQQMEALERQQKQLQDQGGGAARGVEDLRLRLLELSGTEEQIARARHERDEAEVRRQRALQELELQRALLRKDDDEAARLRQEIALLGEQLALLDKVFAEEEKQRKAREKSRGGSGGSDGGGSSGSSGSSGGKGGGAAAPPVNITLNANGVNDPQRLARLIEPELKKLARLAR